VYIRRLQTNGVFYEHGNWGKTYQGTLVPVIPSQKRLPVSIPGLPEMNLSYKGGKRSVSRKGSKRESFACIVCAYARTIKLRSESVARKTFDKVVYSDLNKFIFGKAEYPIKLKNGMVIGGGTVYPEVNMTLGPELIDANSIAAIAEEYHGMLEGICTRARELSVPGFVAEIEVLPPCTHNVKWGTMVCKAVVDTIKEHAAKYGIKGATRLTVVDIREGPELEHMWHGKHWDKIMQSFEEVANVGAEFLAIESIGGKETHDDALTWGDMTKAVFALGVLACRDMEKMWTEIVKIADKTGSIASGDTACALANTAMALADRNLISRVFAATVRVMCAVRTLIAVECGAKGPNKDCGYEGVYVKAIAGTPITTEGHVAACAHLSPFGNISACVPDLWSNESIQNIKLLGGMAPTVSFEQLAYDCRLFNGARAKGEDVALTLRDIYADSDSKYDPMAYILRPDVVLRISKELVKVQGDYARTKKAAELALKEMQAGFDSGALQLVAREQAALRSLSEEIAALPSSESQIISDVMDECRPKLNPKFYDL
jgi:methanol--5-hydroxybenzimidazolylcobamide Co-methyltransferase